MDQKVLDAIFREPRWKRIRNWAGLLSFAILTLAISLYLSNQLQGRTPMGNWFLALFFGFTTLGLTGLWIFERAPLKSTLFILAVGFGCAGLGFRWGSLGVFFGIVIGFIVDYFFASGVLASLGESNGGASPNTSLGRTRGR
jgi:hypothetical protein